MFTVEIKGDSELRARLEAMPDKVRAALFGKVASLASDLHRYIIDSKLSGQVLKHRSGDLWRGVHDEATQGQSDVTGRVYVAGVPYAAIHEYGGIIPAHLVEAKNASSLAFLWKGKMAFFKSVQIPDVTMPERSFMRSSLADKKQDIIDGMSQAVIEAVK